MDQQPEGWNTRVNDDCRPADRLHKRQHGKILAVNTGLAVSVKVGGGGRYFAVPPRITVFAEFMLS